MGPRRTLSMVNRQCKGSSLGPGGPQPCPHTKPRYSLSYHAPLFSPLPYSHFSPSDIRSPTQSTFSSVSQPVGSQHTLHYTCLLYTSDAADERSSVDLGGRRIIKKKK